MTRSMVFSLACAGFAAVAACQQQGATGSPDSGGSGGSGGLPAGSGGLLGSGGDQGSASGGAGPQNSGGMTGSTGGVGATTGSGGANTGGSNAGGDSGVGGSGNARGGSTGSGGAAGRGGPGTGGAAGSGTVNPADVVPELAAGWYWEDSCRGNFDPGGHNCWTDAMHTACPSGGVSIDQTLNVKGTPGQTYTVTVQVGGVAGTRCYQGGMAPSTATVKDNDYNSWWYVGGMPYNATAGFWNTYELHVSPSTGDPSKDVYYFNNSSSRAASGGDCEREASYLVKYTAKFKVVGGGSLLFRIHDNNCKSQMNCGPDQNQNATCSPRKVDLSDFATQPPATSPAAPANQPPSNSFTKKYYPQWLWIAATSVTSP